MYLKSLSITRGAEVIREIMFRNGINLIVDEGENQVTGNSVGKTTVLKLIDFCFGADKRSIYVDPENKKRECKTVRDFLVDEKILITLVLSRSTDKMTDDMIMERNFLSSGQEAIRRINGQQYSEKDFEPALRRFIFPELTAKHPTFRQIVSHNFRYKDESLNNTLKTLNTYAPDVVYETLYLYLFGCDFDKGDAKQDIFADLQQEETFRKRLEKNQTKTGYETTLALIEGEIEKLNERKFDFNLNENFESDLQELNRLKYEINRLSSDIGTLNIRKNLIMETREELSSGVSNIDLEQLRLIYSQAKSHIDNIHKTFEDLVHFHNLMIDEKINFITRDLPRIEENIALQSHGLGELLVREKNLTSRIAKNDSFEELESIITELNEKHQRKGECEGIIRQLNEVENNIKKYNEQMEKIDAEMFSDDFERIVKNQLYKFNKYFSEISNELYEERYAVKYDKTVDAKKRNLYKFTPFSPFGPNIASGKKQGEISCFDIAYTLFADEENIPCLHFILNDKKELMDDKQLVKIADFVNKHNVQFVASILKDKLPPELADEDYFVVKLSQTDKLFRIENIHRKP